ncbi:MAG: NAD-dependent dehydratase [Chloroflexi bacterium]|nr:NAD-dependent dehydratase [Chloroflexota bacterium]
MNLQGKSVLVTGACGFIGSHLVEELVEQGAKVKAFVYYNSFGNWGWLDTLDPRIRESIEVFSGDVCSQDSLKSAFKGTEVVFNLAALIAIPYSYLSPSSYLKTNVEGTLNVLQLSLDFGLNKIIQVSTSETYGTAKYVPIDEGHPMQAQSPYSASKIASDAITNSFIASFNLPVTIARPFNVYGPRQSARAVIPTIISQIFAGKEEINLGSPDPTRDFTFAKDTVSGLRRLAESDKAIGKTINIGFGKEISIRDLALLIKEISNSTININFESAERMRPENSEVNRLLCDNTLLKDLTDWNPNTSLEKGLTETLEWFERNIDLYKADHFNI